MKEVKETKDKKKETNVDYKVTKRNGKKVNYNAAKIGMTIKKAFDGSPEAEKYTPEDSSKIFYLVKEAVEADLKETGIVEVEEIQEQIEKALRDEGYTEVLESFNAYREKRNQSRQVFESYQHKLVKELEALSLKDAIDEDSKRDNANVDGNTPMGTMLHYGSTISKAFAKSHFMKKEFAELKFNSV